MFMIIEVEVERDAREGVFSLPKEYWMVKFSMIVNMKIVRLSKVLKELKGKERSLLLRWAAEIS